MVKPLISIITPLYNAESFIERNILSVQRQTYRNWEHIIVNDCSTDKGAEIVKKWKEKDPRIQFIENKENLGPAVTRNTAIKAAKGHYIAFLDSDDQWYPKKLETQLKFMQEKNIPFSFTYYDQVDEEGKKAGAFTDIPEKVNYSSTLRNNKIGCLTAVYDTSFFGKVYMPLIKRRQDYALWLSLLRKVDYAYCLPEVLATYTLRTNSVSSNKLKLIKYNWTVYRKIEGHSFIKSAFYLCSIIFNKLSRKTETSDL